MPRCGCCDRVWGSRGLGAAGGGCGTPRALVTTLGCCHQQQKRRGPQSCSEGSSGSRHPELQKQGGGLGSGETGGTQHRGPAARPGSRGDKPRTLAVPPPAMLWLVTACPRLRRCQTAPSISAAGGGGRGLEPLGWRVMLPPALGESRGEEEEEAADPHAHRGPQGRPGSARFQPWPSGPCWVWNKTPWTSPEPGPPQTGLGEVKPVASWAGRDMGQPPAPKGARPRREGAAAPGSSAKPPAPEGRRIPRESIHCAGAQRAPKRQDPRSGTRLPATRPLCTPRRGGGRPRAAARTMADEERGKKEKNPLGNFLQVSI